MYLQVLDKEFTICKIKDFSNIKKELTFCFMSITDDEICVICESQNVGEVEFKEDGYIAFRVEEPQIGTAINMIANISNILASVEVGVMVQSTNYTDYFFIKKDSFEKAMTKLSDEGYQVEI